jgi:hypothetical protein
MLIMAMHNTCPIYEAGLRKASDFLHLSRVGDAILLVSLTYEFYMYDVQSLRGEKISQHLSISFFSQNYNGDKQKRIDYPS